MGASPQTPAAAGRTLPSLPIREAGGTPNGRGSSVGCCSLAALAAKKGSTWNRARKTCCTCVHVRKMVEQRGRAGQSTPDARKHARKLPPACVSYRVYDGSDRAENCSKKAVYCKDQSSTAAMEGRCRFPTHETQMALATEARSLRLPAPHEEAPVPKVNRVQH